MKSLARVAAISSIMIGMWMGIGKVDTVQAACTHTNPDFICDARGSEFVCHYPLAEVQEECTITVGHTLMPTVVDVGFMRMIVTRRVRAGVAEAVVEPVNGRK